MLAYTSACLLAFGQEPQPDPQSILLRMRPAGKEGNKQALSLMADLFQPARVEVPSGTTLDQLSQEVCGRIDKDWIASTRRANPSLGRTTITISSPSALNLPPCPFWKSTSTVTVPQAGTLSHTILNQMGTAGAGTLTAVARLNSLSADQLNSALHPGDQIVLPYVTGYYPYRFKEHYQKDDRAAVASIRSIPGFTASLPETEVSLIAEAPNSQCAAPFDDSKWPFDAAELRQILLYNNTKRAGPLWKAVIGIADTGIARSEDRLFLRRNTREIPNNNVDDEGDTYVDDYDGVNMNRAAPGFPVLNEGFGHADHGTHVAGLALGGLKDAELTQIVKDRIALRIINVVRKTVRYGPNGNVTSWPIPNDAIIDALQYIQQEPMIPIINLSVESGRESGLDQILTSNSSLIVAAAGNDQLDLDQTEKYPAAAMNRRLLISVGASDGSGGLAPFSNRGANKVDLAAPGCMVDSIVPGAERREKLSGTSQAAPLVSFTAGLLYSEGLSISQIKNRILLTTDYDPGKLGECGGPGGCVQTKGRLNIARALDIYEDIIVVKQAGGVRTLRGRFIDSCLMIERTCVPFRASLQKVRREGGNVQCWFSSQGLEISTRSCAIGSTSVQFRSTGASTKETISTRDVLDLVPALRY